MNSRIKRGEVYECLFGKYRPALDQQGKAIVCDDGRPAFLRNDFQGPVPYEIQKPRPVVVVGDHKGQYLVVPLSTTLDTHNNPRKRGIARGFHIRIERSELTGLARYNDAEVCWAKANMLQAVDRSRLKPLNQHGHPIPTVSGDVLAAIQEAIIKCIGCQGLLETKRALSEPACSAPLPQGDETELSECNALINKENSDVSSARGCLFSHSSGRIFAALAERHLQYLMAERHPEKARESGLSLFPCLRTSHANPD